MKSGAFITLVSACAALTISDAKAAPNRMNLPPAFAAFLKSYLARRSETGADLATEVAVTRLNLGASGQDAYVAYVRGGGWCGSGGCVTLVAVRQGERYEALAFLPATELPIVLLASIHAGGRDLAVTLKGALDGDHFDPPVRAVLSLSGHRYKFDRPRAATVPIGVGDVLIPENAKFIPLYGVKSR